MSEATQKKFRKFVRELGRLLREEADKGLVTPDAKDQDSTPPWKSAFIDVRWFADAEGWSAKIRAALPNNTRRGLRINRDMNNIVIKISTLRKEDPSVEWYGLKVCVTPNGEVTTELNNDPNCVIDPTWFKS